MSLRQPHLYALLIILSQSPGANVHGREWQKQATVPVSLEYTDNLFLNTERPVSDMILTTGAAFRLDGLSEQNSITISGGVESHRYQKTRDANNIFYNTEIGYGHAFESGTFGVIAEYNETSTRTTDLETIGVINNFLFGKRRLYSLRSTIQNSINDLNSLSIDALLERSEYDQPNYIDYRNHILTIAWDHILSGSSAITTQLQAQRYDAVIEPVDYDYGTARLLYNRSLTSEWRYEVGAGAGYVAREDASNYNTLLLSFLAAKDMEYARFLASADSNITPTAAGQLTRLTALELAYMTFVNENSQWRVSLRATRSEIIDFEPPYSNDYLLLETGYNTMISEIIELDIAYRYTNSKSNLDLLNRTANSILAQLTLNFEQ